MRSVVVIRSAQQRVALHVDEVLGNQEAGGQEPRPAAVRPARPGRHDAVLASVRSLIYNPVALATLYGDTALALMRSSADGGAGALVQPEPGPPMPRRWCSSSTTR